MRDLTTLQEKDEEALAEETCKAFFTELKRLVEEEESVVVSLCGGRSIQPFYKKIPEFSGELSKEEWKKIHFFWTDERLVGPLDKDSNFRLADRLFLRELGRRRLLLEENVHRFRGEEKDVDEEIARYDDELGEISNGQIHITILGVGEDGHIGALYPGHELVEEEIKEFLHLDDSPKPPAERMTIAPKHVTDSDAAFVFFISDAKKEAYEAFKKGKDHHDWPCRLAKQGAGKTYVVTDLE